MSIDFYLLPASAPCRAVGLTAEALGIGSKLQHHKVDLQKGGQFEPRFMKLNPQHTVPTIVDGGFAVWESRAILRYLANQYGGPDCSLYPEEPKARALVDQRLDFDLGTLYATFATHYYPQIFGAPVQEGSLQKLQNALGFLNTFLEGQKYVAGNNLTIADLSMVATLSTIEIVGMNVNEYPNIARWYALVKTTAPNYIKANEEPLVQFKALMDNKK